MKHYLIEIRETKETPKIFIMEFENRKQLKSYLSINWFMKKYKIRIFELKKVIIDNITKNKKQNEYRK